MANTRIKADPGAKVPKEGLEHIPSIFVSKEAVAEMRRELMLKDNLTLDHASNHVLRAVVHLAALGLPNRAITNALDIPIARVRTILSASKVKDEVERIQLVHYKRDAEEMFKRLVPAAVKNIFEIMVKKTGRDAVRLAAAQYITDRALGKPKETIETKTDMLAEVFGALNTKNSSQAKPIEAEFEPVSDNQSQDPLDELLGEHSK